MTRAADGQEVVWNPEDALPEAIQESYISMPEAVQHKHQLKIGLRAVREFENKKLLSYKYLYQKSSATCWWWEHVNILGRMCYGFLSFFPPYYQLRLGAGFSV